MELPFLAALAGATFAVAVLWSYGALVAILGAWLGGTVFALMAALLVVYLKRRNAERRPERNLPREARQH